MGASQGIFALVAIIGISLGIILFFIDGMLLWSIGFFSLGIILILLNVMWGISGWAENVTRNLGDGS